jgi:hypothetical protein
MMQEALLRYVSQGVSCGKLAKVRELELSAVLISYILVGRVVP